MIPQSNALTVTQRGPPHFFLTCYPRPLGQGTLRLAVFTGFGLLAVGWSCLTRVPGRSSIHVSQLRPASLSLKRPSPQALTLPGGARSNTWDLLLGECRRGSVHIWNLWACVGYCLHLVPTIKIPCAVLTRTWSAQQIPVSVRVTSFK